MKIKYNLNAGFKLVQAGERVLEITKAEAKPSGKPSKIVLGFKDVEDGATLQNNYDLSNNGAIYALGLVCKYSLGLEDEDEIDTVTDLPKLVGKKVICEVVHNEGSQPKEDGTLPVFANIAKVIGGVEGTTGEVKTSPRASISTMDDLD
jgi:hypothetical protein